MLALHYYTSKYICFVRQLYTHKLYSHWSLKHERRHCCRSLLSRLTLIIITIIITIIINSPSTFFIISSQKRKKNYFQKNIIFHLCIFTFSLLFFELSFSLSASPLAQMSYWACYTNVFVVAVADVVVVLIVANSDVNFWSWCLIFSSSVYVYTVGLRLNIIYTHTLRLHQILYTDTYIHINNIIYTRKGISIKSHRRK